MEVVREPHRRLATSSRQVLLKVALSCLAAVLICIVLLPAIGSVPVSYGRAWAEAQPDKQILWDIRMPRVLLALLAGGALALAGVLFQALLRDALATPYTLGVSSGAALGAVIAICFGLRPVWSSSFAGAALTLLTVLGAAAKGRKVSPFTLLLAGVTINSICTALILLLYSVASFGQSIAITRWLMGGIVQVEYSTLAWLAAGVLPVCLYAFSRARYWNLLAVGEEWAAVRGVSTTTLIVSGYLIGSFLTGAVTSLTGPIGFVELIVPHALRLKLGADHRLLIPSSFLVGGVFLAVCDTVARTVLAPAELPVGVITAMIGGPFFIWMLRFR